MLILNTLMVLLSALLALQAAFFLLQLLASLRDTPLSTGPDQAVKVAVVIPAHNEAAVIAKTLSSLCPQLNEGDQILVVADNCSDETAAIARSFNGYQSSSEADARNQQGAVVTVVERQHATERGKGYALAYGINELKQAPPDIVIIVDADCTAAEDAINLLKREAHAHGRPVQANYIIANSEHPSLTDRISAFALVIKNVARLRGTRSLGIPSLLVGAGMAFPWSQISQIELASGNIVEDMQMGVDLALVDAAPIYCDTAVVRSVLPEGKDTALNQRKRWEHGHINTLLTQVPRLLGAGIFKARPALIAHAIDLSIPPLSLFVAILILTVVAAGLLLFVGGSSTPLQLAISAMGSMGIAILVGWFRYGRTLLSLHHLLRIPQYILWKLPLYARFLVKRETSWVRTPRSDEQNNKP